MEKVENVPVPSKKVENVPVPSKRDQFKTRLRHKYPDMDFDDDDVFFGRINDDYDDYDKDLLDYKEREFKLSDMFSSDPRSAHFLTNWKNGSDPFVELIRQFGTDVVEAANDPERQEEMAAANKEFVDRVAKEKELDEEYEKNISESLEMLSSYQQEHGLSDDEVDNIMELIVGVMRDGILGKFRPETIDMAMKALNYDSAVATADHEGEVRGRNSKIDERLRKQKKGDGLPNLDGKNGGANSGKHKRNMDVFDFANAAK